MELQPFSLFLGIVKLRQPVIPAVFSGQPYTFVNGVMWTIPIEFACYLDILVIGVTCGFKRGFCLATTATLLAICTIDKFGYSLSWVSRFSLDLAGYFAVGGCFYVFRDRICFFPLAAVISMIILFVGLFSWRIHQIAFSLAGAYLLFYFGLAKIHFLKNFGAHPDVSYGVYLFGWPIQKLILWWFPGSSPWTVFFASAMTALVDGWISWHFVEKRFLKSKHIAIAPHRESLSTAASGDSLHGVDLNRKST